jgi:hypothetical protein
LPCCWGSPSRCRQPTGLPACPADAAISLSPGTTAQHYARAASIEDGSTLIIRNGIAVPNPAILESRRQLPAPEPEEWEDMRIVGTSPCERLERKVCGPENECLHTEVCTAVSQLVEREWNERRASHNTGYMTPTSGQCLQALKDTGFFVKCPTETR